MNISFVTTWSDYFSSPTVTVYSDRQEIVILPLHQNMTIEDKNGKLITDEAARRAYYTEAMSAEIREHSFNAAEVALIIAFLVNDENFAPFKYLLHRPEIDIMEAYPG